MSYGSKTFCCSFPGILFEEFKEICEQIKNNDDKEKSFFRHCEHLKFLYLNLLFPENHNSFKNS